jgi:hypothetical protein
MWPPSTTRLPRFEEAHYRGSSRHYRDSAFPGRSIFRGLLRDLFGFDHLEASLKVMLEAARHAVRAPMRRNGVVAYGSDPIEGLAMASRFDDELKGNSREMSGFTSQAAIDEAQVRLKRRLLILTAAGIDVDLVIVPVHIWRLEYFRQADVEAQSDA